MNKKVMALAVAGALAAPAAAFAQASNVQVFGTMYMEYDFIHQGQKIFPTLIGPAGDLVNIDLLQSPGSEVGFKGEEALGGGTTAWFQCVSTAEIRGAGSQITGVASNTNPSNATQNSGVFCGRNSAIGVKGGFGNVYAGNWDMPMKKTAGAIRIVSDTGLWGVGPMLFGGSSSYMDATTATAWSRRQNSSIFYDTPVWGGFQIFTGISTSVTDVGILNTVTGAKPRAMGIAANYTNGPLLLTLGFERHNNFFPITGAINNSTSIALTGTNVLQATTDWAWQAGVSYQFGPLKAGLIYTKQTYDFGTNGLGGTAADGAVSAWNLAGEWAIAGPHALRGAYTRANSTTGTYGGANQTGGGTVVVQTGLRGWNGGAGGTGANMWQVQYVYNASKRTEFTVGFAAVQNDTSARYNLGGATSPAMGVNQSGFGVSMKNTF